MSSELEVVPGDRQRSDRGRCRDRRDVPRRRPGRSSATSRATMPPSEPPVTRAISSTPSSSRRRHWARAWSTRRDGGKARAVRPAGSGIERGRSGGPVAAAEQVGADDARPLGVERAALADQRLPPVAGRVGRTGQRVDHEDLRRGVGRRAVVPVGDDQVRQRRPAFEREWPQRHGLDGRPVPGRETGRPGRWSAGGSSGRADEAAVGGAFGGRGRERLLEVGDQVVDVLEADRQPDEVRRDAGRDPALRARAASAWWMPGG